MGHGKAALLRPAGNSVLLATDLLIFFPGCTQGRIFFFLYLNLTCGGWFPLRTYATENICIFGSSASFECVE